MNISNYLDLGDIWINELFGDPYLFTLVILAVLFYVSIKSKVSVEVTILFAFLFLSIMFARYLDSFKIFWVAVVLGIGVLFYYKYKKVIER